MSETRCYMIVTAAITDRPRFVAGYAAQVPALVNKFGGRYLLKGSGGIVLEGGVPPGPSALISEWPDREAALRFWNSAEYQALKALRDGTGIFQVILIDSVPIATTLRQLAGETP